MSNTYIVTDLHLFHDKMVDYCRRPPTAELHDMIERRWNATVQPEDTVINLGDVCFGGSKEQLTEYTKKLNGTKILVRGNHDKSHSNKWFTDCGYAFVCEFLCIGGILLSHRPLDFSQLADRVDCNIFGHFHNAPKTRWEHTIKQRITAKHYLLSFEYVNYTPVKLFDAIRSRSVVCPLNIPDDKGICG